MSISASTHFRVHERDVLIDELHRFANDRERHGKTERARLARAAAAELDNGADRVFFERCYYVVGSADRYTAYTGSRDEIVRELDDYGRGQVHMGAQGRAQEAARALSAIEDGETKIRVGNLVYEVVDPTSVFTGTREQVLEQIRIRGLAAARTHHKPEERELEAAQAAIEAGAESATARGTTYRVA